MLIDKYCIESKWFENYSSQSQAVKIKCTLCPHNCVLAEGQRGICRVRAVINGKLYSLVYGRACSVCLDPIEKKPLYRFLPGTKILSIATVGCNLRCVNCQNAHISQVEPEKVNCDYLPPDKVVELAQKTGVPSIAYTYTEPFIFYEYVYDTAKSAQENGIKNVLVTAGYVNQKPLLELCPFIDAANVDLKCFDEDYYLKYSKIKMQPVLDTIITMKKQGIHIELTNLIIPTLSDDLSVIKKMCEWIVKELGTQTPLHFSRFFPMHQLSHLPPTGRETLEQAKNIALNCGLEFVYLGNI